MLQERRTEKAGFLLETTAIIVESNALNSNGFTEVIRTDQIGNFNWQLRIKSFLKWVKTVIMDFILDFVC